MDPQPLHGEVREELLAGVEVRDRPEPLASAHFRLEVLGVRFAIKGAAAVPAAAPGVEEGDARRLTGLFSHALPGTLAV